MDISIIKKYIAPHQKHNIILSLILSHIHYILFYEDNVYMDDTLGIYNNNTIYNENTFNVDKHMKQGINFMNYGKMYSNAKENQFSLLTDTSAPTIGSIVEAWQDGPNSTDANAQAQKTGGQTDQEARFNSLLSAYSVSYNTFNTLLLKPSPSADDLAQRKVMEQDLSEKYQQLSSLANIIQGNFQQLQDLRNGNMNNADKTNQQLLIEMDELERQHRKMKHSQHRYDNDTIDGELEAGSLINNSFQLHYLVYLIISITVIAFILNLSINPNANAMNAIYVLGALLTVYAISRWII